MLRQTVASHDDSCSRTGDHPAHSQREVDTSGNSAGPGYHFTRIECGYPEAAPSQAHPEREEEALTMAYELVKWMQAKRYSNSQIAHEMGVAGVKNEDDLIYGLAVKLYWGA